MLFERLDAISTHTPMTGLVDATLSRKSVYGQLLRLFDGALHVSVSWPWTPFAKS
jgi:hypothetical protein